MFVSAPRFRKNAPKFIAALTALSLTAAPAAFACEDMSVALGNGWTGMVDGVEGMCSIYKESGDGRSLSVYSDVDNRGGYWMMSAYEGSAPKSNIVTEGDVRLELILNGKSAGFVTAQASGDPGGADWSGYQDYRIDAAQMDAITAKSPKGFKLEARKDGATVFTIDATGAKKAFKDYGNCHTKLPDSWEALASAQG